MDEHEYQLNFPSGARIPALLPELLRFENRSVDWYSGRFQSTTWKYGDAAWCRDNRQAAEQIAVIGRGPDGSLYALWLYPGRTLDDAPVVFLGSEGTHNGLLADSLREFLALLAVGADELGFDVSWADIQQANPPAARLDEFRRWLDASFGIVAPETPYATVTSARARHPDFEAWLDEVYR